MRSPFEPMPALTAPSLPNKPMHATCETHARDGRRWASQKMYRNIQVTIFTGDVIPVVFCALLCDVSTPFRTQTLVGF